MDFVPIFEYDKRIERLFALVNESGVNVLDEALEFWNDPKSLRKYFKSNSNVLKYYNMDVNTAVLKTTEIARKIEDTLCDNQFCLDELFEKIDNRNYSYLEPDKYIHKWLRLYAIMLEPNHYVIVGSAIKQSQVMQDNPHTAAELENVFKVRDFLMGEGIMDADSFKDAVFVLSL
ncbi:MAG: hypothetical protein U0Y96_05425 [Candidatus Kapaibacterium sp.]